MTNPLLQFDALPRFPDIKPEHVAPAVDELLAQSDAALERAVGPDVPADFDAVSAALSVVTERLARSWGAVSHLTHVADTPELRAAYAASLPKVIEFYTRQSSDARLYAKYRAIDTAPTAQQLSPARRQALKLWLRDFRLGGADLVGDAKARYAAISEELALLAQQFSNHVLDATDAYAYLATPAEMQGMPDDVLRATRVDGPAGEPRHKLTLHFPCYLPVMQYAQDRALRERLYRAYTTRASEFGPADQDNSTVMARILALRTEKAQLLGYRSYAELSLVPKMAESPAQVMSFLRDLAHRARPAAQRDLDELREFAARELGLTDLQSWDVAYASEKLKESRYSFSEQEVKAYFTQPKVLDGLFRIIETVFGVAIRAATAPVWNDGVRFYRIERAGQLVGEFYLDLHARPGKRPGAWMDDTRHRWRRPDGHGLQTPVAQLVCNFAAPVGDAPALLTHSDVITLFHEFGHGLHHLLTQVDELGVSGISGVEWDAVELPSQFMENFCWEWDVLKHLTAHVDTGQPLPRALYERMLTAKNFQSGMQMLRQLQFALFDIRLHDEANGSQHVMAIEQQVRDEVAVLKSPTFARAPHSFSHIFAGGYAAGYYSYMWAEVLSADAWSAFEDQGALDAGTGARFRTEILEAGGSRPALESFKAFRGREPSIEPLLRHQGITTAAA